MKQKKIDIETVVSFRKLELAKTVSSLHLEALNVSKKVDMSEDEKQLINPKYGEKITSVSKFVIREKLGEGGMGLVYQSDDINIGRTVAIKQMHPYLSNIERIKDGFVNEAYITGRLEHPNIPPVYTVDLSGENLSMVMKLVSGVTFENILNPNSEEDKKIADKYSFEQKLKILIDVCNPVRFAHARGIVHRDIKPANIMIGEFGEIFLMDWGLACAVEKEENIKVLTSVKHRSEITGPEGTWAYAPPEMMDGFGPFIGYHSDIYLLSAILYQIMNDFPPHSMRAYKKFDTIEERDLITSLDPAYDFELRHICMIGLDPDPARRFKSVEDLQTALIEYLKHRNSHLICKKAEESLVSGLKEIKDIKASGRSISDYSYDFFHEAVLGFKNSLELWDENKDAADGLKKAKIEMAEVALDLQDFSFGLAQLKDLEQDECEELISRLKTAKERAVDDYKSRIILKRLKMALFILFLIAGTAGMLIYFDMTRTAKKTGLHVKNLVYKSGQQDLLLTTEATSDNIVVWRSYLQSLLNSFKNNIETSVKTINYNGGQKYIPSDEKAFADKKKKSLSRGRSYYIFNKAEYDKNIEILSKVYPVIENLKDVDSISNDKIIKYYMAFESGLFIDYPSNDKIKENYNPLERGWYKQAKQSSKLIFTHVYRDFHSGNLVMTAAVPINDSKGNFIGVAALDFRINDILNYVKLKDEWKQSGKVFLGVLDEKNQSIKRVASSHDLSKKDEISDEIRFLNNKNDTYKKLQKELSGLRPGIVEYKKGDEIFELGYAPLAGSKAFVVISVNHKEMVSMATNVQNNIISQIDDNLKEIASIIGILFILTLAGFLYIIRKNK